MAIDVIKIAIVGPESTGKTTLAEQLARHYQTVFVPEYAREYLTHLSGQYKKEDVEKIAKKQIELEDSMVHKANQILICDTNLLVIKIWMEDKYVECPEWILQEIKKRKYDLHILTDVDIQWKADILRENPERGEYFFELYKKEMSLGNIKYKVVSGNLDERLSNATRLIDSIT